jgi:AMIN domain
LIDVDRLGEDKSDVRGLSALAPEIKRVSSEGTYMHLLIEGTNFRRGSIVEFVKAGNVVFQQSPVRLTQGQLTVIVPAKKIEELGKFEVRVVTGNRITTDLATVEPLTLLPSNGTRAIQGNPGKDSSLPPASVVHSVHQRVDNNVIRVFIDTDGATKIQAFTLANPFRVVLDIIGVRNTFGNKTMQVGGPLVERVRIGQPKPGVVRVVLDAKVKVAYSVTREGGSIVVAVGDRGFQAGERILRTRWE